MDFKEKRAVQKSITEKLSKLQAGDLPFKELRTIQKEITADFTKLGEKKVDIPDKWADTDAEIQAIGKATITSIGEENVYAKKADGTGYFFKPISTDKYKEGPYDFSNEIVFDDGTGSDEYQIDLPEEIEGPTYDELERSGLLPERSETPKERTPAPSAKVQDKMAQDFIKKHGEVDFVAEGDGKIYTVNTKDKMVHVITENSTYSIKYRDPTRKGSGYDNMLTDLVYMYSVDLSKAKIGDWKAITSEPESPAYDKLKSGDYIGLPAAEFIEKLKEAAKEIGEEDSLTDRIIDPAKAWKDKREEVANEGVDQEIDHVDEFLNGKVATESADTEDPEEKPVDPPKNQEGEESPAEPEKPEGGEQEPPEQDPEKPANESVEESDIDEESATEETKEIPDNPDDSGSEEGEGELEETANESADQADSELDQEAEDQLVEEIKGDYKLEDGIATEKAKNVDEKLWKYAKKIVLKARFDKKPSGDNEKDNTAITKGDAWGFVQDRYQKLVTGKIKARKPATESAEESEEIPANESVEDDEEYIIG